MLVHSYIYYFLGSATIVDDPTFDRWAYELVKLQEKYPKASRQAPYFEFFHDWDGTTGYDLAFPGDIIEKAHRILYYHNEKEV